MAIVPNLWGIWNVLYIRLRRRRYVSIGFHGAFLAFVQILIAFGITRLVSFEIPEFMIGALPFGLPIVPVIFYLVWKHAVAFLNAVLGIE